MSPMAGTTTQEDSSSRSVRPGDRSNRKSRRRWWLAFLVLVVCFVAVLHWGAWLLMASDPLPARVDGAIVLQGSVAGEIARIAGAMDLLQQGRADRMLISVPRESYWGEAVAPSARRYVERKYGLTLASRVEFCELGPGVNSTEQEATALIPCIRDREWKAIAVVTSNYHSRRAGMLWRNVLKKQDPAVRLWIHGVPDPEFNPEQWWRERQSAKTWYMESTKLIWTCLFR